MMRAMRDIPPGTPVCSEEGLPSEGMGGELEAGRLLQGLRPELVRFAYWLVRDRQLAEDVVQESLLRAWRSRAGLKDRTAARAWLFTIVRREHARLYERKRLETVDLHEAITREDGRLAGPGAGELEDLHLALLKLPDDYRIPLVMQVMGGFSAAEIGRELELSVPAVLTRLFRARNRLRTIYGFSPVADGIEDGDRVRSEGISEHSGPVPDAPDEEPAG